jgi:hypothetical protein
VPWTRSAGLLMPLLSVTEWRVPMARTESKRNPLGLLFDRRPLGPNNAGCGGVQPAVLADLQRRGVTTELPLRPCIGTQSAPSAMKGWPPLRHTTSTLQRTGQPDL